MIYLHAIHANWSHFWLRDVNQMIAWLLSGRARCFAIMPSCLDKVDRCLMACWLYTKRMPYAAMTTRHDKWNVWLIICWQVRHAGLRCSSIMPIACFMNACSRIDAKYDGHEFEPSSDTMKCFQFLACSPIISRFEVSSLIPDAPNAVNIRRHGIALYYHGMPANTMISRRGEEACHLSIAISSDDALNYAWAATCRAHFVTGWGKAATFEWNGNYIDIDF